MTDDIEFEQILNTNRDRDRFSDPKWQIDNLEYDLLVNDWILDKVRDNKDYAQHLYAALCNNDFTKNDVWPILSEKRWSCSWRYAGGIIARMTEKGDYMDWYCTGIRSHASLSEEEINDLTEDEKTQYLEMEAYVSEGLVTDEIRNDLFKLGWIITTENENE